METMPNNEQAGPGAPPLLPEELPRLLLAWYDQNARALPWRENAEPYRVWISEIMLQQTNVATVGPYYERFLGAFPTVGALASADEQKVLKLWEGLGYYARARNLKNAAGIIVRDCGGRFPDTYDAIRRLPGVGPYTAGAIASICFEAPVPAVDGNAERVVSRLAGLYAADRNTLKKQVTSLLSGIYPAARRGDFTQSLMELGALVCAPSGAAKCDSCPVSGRWRRMRPAPFRPCPSAAKGRKESATKSPCSCCRSAGSSRSGKEARGDFCPAVGVSHRFGTSERIRDPRAGFALGRAAVRRHRR
jgi:A/G-specific adenine glycosylase